MVFVLAAAGAFAVLWKGRSYPWQLALLAGLAIGALAWVSLRTAYNLWALSTREPPSMEWADRDGSRPPQRSAADASSSPEDPRSGAGSTR